MVVVEIVVLSFQGQLGIVDAMAEICSKTKLAGEESIGDVAPAGRDIQTKRHRAVRRAKNLRFIKIPPKVEKMALRNSLFAK